MIFLNSQQKNEWVLAISHLLMWHLKAFAEAVDAHFLSF